MKINLAQFDNSWFVKKSKWKMISWYFINAIFFTTPFFPFSRLKVGLLRLFGARIGKGVIIKPKVNIKYPWNLTIANNCWIGENVWIDNLALVAIESNVCISQGAMLLCGNHNYKKVSFDLLVGQIKLEEGVWIGAQAVVCPGIVCRTHSILTVGSIATKNLKAYSIYQGNPAEFVKTRIVEE